MPKNKEPAYKRGKYNKKVDQLYRSKVQKQETRVNCAEIYQFIDEKQRELKTKFQQSYNRSKVLENFQSLKDFLKKQIVQQQVEEEANLEVNMKIQYLERELQELRSQLGQNPDEGSINNAFISEEELNSLMSEPLFRDSSN